MQKCINETACDHSHITATGTTVQRRSIGYRLPHGIDVVVNATATSVNDTAITFQDRQPEGVGDGDIVILAAGALTSPQLLGQRRNICGHNHYYTAPGTVWNFLDPVPTQHFQYFTGGWEHNIARMYVGPPLMVVHLNISLQMDTTDIRECHNVGENYTTPAGAQGTQAWHYMGTIDHTLFSAPGLSRVFVGDASAILKPFNCHTSMPAAAAGVMAVQSALGTLEGQEATPTELEGGQDRGWFMIFFSVGTILLVAGIVCHWKGGLIKDDAASKRWKKQHYWLMPLGIVIIVTGVLTIKRGRPSVLYGDFAYHKGLGIALIVWMALQSVAGSWVKVKNKAWEAEVEKDPSKKNKKPPHAKEKQMHRASGFLLMLVLTVMIAHVAIAGAGPISNYNGATAYRVLAGITAGLTLLTVCIGALWMWGGAHPQVAIVGESLLR